VPVGTYTVTAPQITIAGYQFTAQPQTVTVSEGQTTTVVITYVGTPINNSTNCSVTVQIGTPWQGPAAGTYQNVINLFVTNNDTETVPVPWTIAITNANYQAISGYWNLAIDSVQNGTITGQAQSSWEALQKNQGNTVNVGMIVTSGSSDFTPSSITINGSPCTITITH